MNLDHAICGVSSSPDLDQYTAAKTLAQAKYKTIRKSGVHEVENFRFATLKDVTDALLPALLSEGFPMPTFSSGFHDKYGWVMVGKLAHKSGQWESAMAPLLLGYEASTAGIQTFAANCTEAKKILFQGLAGGWQEVDGVKEEELPVVEAAPEPKKGEPKPVVKPLTVIQRAEARLKEKFSSGSIEDIEKIFAHLALLIDSNEVKQSEVDALKKKYAPKEQEAISAK